MHATFKAPLIHKEENSLFLVLILFASDSINRMHRTIATIGSKIRLTSIIENGTIPVIRPHIPAVHL